MKYIFEDKADDVLSILFSNAYTQKAKNNFVYAGGNSEAVSAALSLVQNEDVSVYLDMIPGNTECARLYKILSREVQLGLTHKLYVFPIVCSEFYFIKYLAGFTDVFKSFDNVNICLNKGDYRKSMLYANGNKACKNFEKFCKYIIIHDVPDCIRHSRRLDNTYNNGVYGKFCTEDCNCSNCSLSCFGLSSIQKSLSLLMQYDAVPSGSLGVNKYGIIHSEVVKIHNKLVDEYTAFLNSYISLGILDKYSKKEKSRMVINKIPY